MWRVRVQLLLGTRRRKGSEEVDRERRKMKKKQTYK
jgi:hypothetical protein